MGSHVPKLRLFGGDHRSSAWFGLAKLLMHNEHQRVEALRRSRRKRAKAAGQQAGSNRQSGAINDSTPVDTGADTADPPSDADAGGGDAEDPPANHEDEAHDDDPGGEGNGPRPSGEAEGDAEGEPGSHEPDQRPGEDSPGHEHDEASGGGGGGGVDPLPNPTPNATAEETEPHPATEPGNGGNEGPQSEHGSGLHDEAETNEPTEAAQPTPANRAISAPTSSHSASQSRSLSHSQSSLRPYRCPPPTRTILSSSSTGRPPSVTSFSSTQGSRRARLQHSASISSPPSRTSSHVSGSPRPVYRPDMITRTQSRAISPAQPQNTSENHTRVDGPPIHLTDRATHHVATTRIVQLDDNHHHHRQLLHEHPVCISIEPAQVQYPAAEPHPLTSQTSTAFPAYYLHPLQPRPQPQPELQSQSQSQSQYQSVSQLERPYQPQYQYSYPYPHQYASSAYRAGLPFWPHTSLVQQLYM